MLPLMYHHAGGSAATRLYVFMRGQAAASTIQHALLSDLSTKA